MTVLMWEARAADGRLDDLVNYARTHADPAAQVFRSNGPEPRLVVIDPAGQGLPDVDSALLARPAHSWRFEPVER
ncbi:MAG: hypothetical protein ABI232_03690 [Jatrophihabitantaceae bacterium]